MVGNCPQHVQGSLSLKANGKPVIHFPVALTTDETSANCSKQYNKFESCFVYFPALPAKFHGPLYINFVCASHDRDWRDVNEAVLMDFKPNGALDSGIEVYDSHTNQMVIVVTNNPRHYQVCKLGGQLQITMLLVYGHKRRSSTHNSKDTSEYSGHPPANEKCVIKC
ncbi:hypothetical protein HDU77_010260 [Chytriomyces hyalinus]|nr:hypothetical protein HDU77_010260 [Chytriomyces hyalinus]